MMRQDGASTGARQAPNTRKRRSESRPVEGLVGLQWLWILWYACLNATVDNEGIDFVDLPCIFGVILLWAGLVLWRHRLGFPDTAAKTLTDGAWVPEWISIQGTQSGIFVGVHGRHRDFAR